MAKKKLILNESVTRRFMKLATIKPAYVSNFINEAEMEMAEEEEEEAPEGLEMDAAEAPEGEEEPMEDPELEAEDEMEDPVGEEGVNGAESLVMDLLTKVQEFAEENGVSMELEGDEAPEEEGALDAEEGEEDLDMEMGEAEPEGGESPEEDGMEMDMGAEEEMALQEKIIAEVTKRVAKRLLNAAKRK
jgi:hypothetical protein